MGYATSRAEARQLVKHGHFRLNGKSVKSPSILVNPGNTVTLRERSKKVERVVAALDALEGRSVPQWLEVETETQEGTVKQLPVRGDITLPIDEQLIVELYSR
jgi:small subunit ribosomal protein S4